MCMYTTWRKSSVAATVPRHFVLQDRTMISALRSVDGYRLTEYDQRIPAGARLRVAPNFLIDERLFAEILSRRTSESQHPLWFSEVAINKKPAWDGGLFLLVVVC